MVSNLNLIPGLYFWFGMYIQNILLHLHFLFLAFGNGNTNKDKHDKKYKYLKRKTFYQLYDEDVLFHWFDN